MCAAGFSPTQVLYAGRTRHRPSRRRSYATRESVSAMLLQPLCGSAGASSWDGENSINPSRPCFGTLDGIALPAQRAGTIEPGAERWRRSRRHRAALGKRRNNPQAPNGALQNMTRVRTLVNTILSMKISQEANVVRNTRRVGPCCAPVGALMVLGPVYLGRRSAAAPLRLPQAGL